MEQDSLYYVTTQAKAEHARAHGLNPADMYEIADNIYGYKNRIILCDRKSIPYYSILNRGNVIQEVATRYLEEQDFKLIEHDKYREWEVMSPVSAYYMTQYMESITKISDKAMTDLCAEYISNISACIVLVVSLLEDPQYIQQYYTDVCCIAHNLLKVIYTRLEFSYVNKAEIVYALTESRNECYHTMFDYYKYGETLWQQLTENHFSKDSRNLLMGVCYKLYNVVNDLIGVYDPHQSKMFRSLNGDEIHNVYTSLEKYKICEKDDFYRYDILPGVGYNKTRADISSKSSNTLSDLRQAVSHMSGD